jgi:hypothetical protein
VIRKSKRFAHLLRTVRENSILFSAIAKTFRTDNGRYQRRPKSFLLAGPDKMALLRVGQQDNKSGQEMSHCGTPGETLNDINSQYPTSSLAQAR